MHLPEHEKNIPLKYLASVAGGSKRLVRCRHFNQNSDIWILAEQALNFVEHIEANAILIACVIFIFCLTS